MYSLSASCCAPERHHLVAPPRGKQCLSLWRDQEVYHGLHYFVRIARIDEVCRSLLRQSRHEALRHRGSANTRPSRRRGAVEETDDQGLISVSCVRAS